MPVWDYMAQRTPTRRSWPRWPKRRDRLTQDFGTWQRPVGRDQPLPAHRPRDRADFRRREPSIPVPFTSSQWGSLASFGAKRYPGTSRYYGTNGNSFVAVVEFGPRCGRWRSPRAARAATRIDTLQRPGAALRRGNLRPVYFYPEDLQGHVERRYHPGPVAVLRAPASKRPTGRFILTLLVPIKRASSPP